MKIRPMKRKVRVLTKQQKAAMLVREAKLQKLQIKLGFAIIGICLLISIWMTIIHQLIPAVPIGLFILAGLRLLFLKFEVRKNTQECSK